MHQYFKELQRILDTGIEREGKTGRTRTLFGLQMRFYLSDGFPIVATTHVSFRGVKAELIGFIRAYNSEKEFSSLLDDDGAAAEDASNGQVDSHQRVIFRRRWEGDLGRLDGVQWRQWRTQNGHLDQLAYLIRQLTQQPNSRRHILTAWNPGELDEMVLPPCVVVNQFFVAAEKLSLHLYLRSGDMVAGVPHNIAAGALLLCLVAHVTGLEPAELIITLGDAYIHKLHTRHVRQQLNKAPLRLPTLHLNKDILRIDDFKMQDIQLTDYLHA